MSTATQAPTLPALPPLRVLGTYPVCTVCGDTDPRLVETGDAIGSAVTACCGENPVADTCADCGAAIYYTPDGSEPDHCPNCT